MATFLCVDRVALGPDGPWAVLRARIGFGHYVERGITADRLALHDARQAAAAGGPTFLLGSSRARMGFVTEAVSTEPGAFPMITKLAHAGIGPFEIRSAVDEILSYDPAAVVWMLSEFDTHRPLQPLPGAPFGSVAAVVDLAGVLGPTRAAEHRVSQYRLTLDAMFNSYRYRNVLGCSGADRLRRFPMGGSISLRRGGPPELIPGGRPTPLSRADRLRLARQLQARFGKIPKPEIAQVRSITRGAHAEAQMELLRRAAARLRAHGVRVIVVELPLHPLAAAYYDESIRNDFLHFAAEMVTEYGVRFVALEDSGPFSDADFLDLTHLKTSGARKVTAATLAAVEGGGVAARLPRGIVRGDHMSSRIKAQ